MPGTKQPRYHGVEPVVAAAVMSAAALLYCAPQTSRPRVPDSAASLAFKGLPPLRGLAISPQGGLFATTLTQGGLVLQVFGNDTWSVLFRTGGQPGGLAFDPAGDVYVADKGLGKILRITRSGRASVAADRCGGTPLIAPEGIGIDARGAVYFTDVAASRVCRIAAQANADIVASGVRPSGPLAVSAEGSQLFIADDSRSIWRMSGHGDGRVRLASFAEGRPSGIALDDSGNVYVALQDGGKVVALNSAGQLIGTYSGAGAAPAHLAFGGLDLATLFIGGSAPGTVFKSRTARRAQRQVWEDDSPLSITDPPDGAILNRHDGEVTGDGLSIAVHGKTRLHGPVRVNGVAASVNNGEFQAKVTLPQRENRIVVEVPNGPSAEATVFWDRSSFPRYRFSTDDNIWFLRDIARNADRYTSIFDNPYLAMWRELHRKYGTKFHHNIYYQTEGFNLSRMPDKFRSEWQRNSDWMRLSFHALGNDPDRPYVHASAEQIVRDYRLVVREIERFAGKEVLYPVTTVHWGEATSEAARALRREGVRVMVSYFEVQDDLPAVSLYLTVPQLRYMMGRDYWKDTREDITFVRHDMVINLVPLNGIDRYLERVAADPHQSEVIEMMIHEQYFYPDYVAYEPDYRQRVERAIEWVTRKGYRPVFYEDDSVGSGGDIQTRISKGT